MKKIWFLISICWFCCLQAKYEYYKVKKGDSLYKISRMYHLDFNDLIEIADRDFKAF